MAHVHLRREMQDRVRAQPFELRRELRRAHVHHHQVRSGRQRLALPMAEIVERGDRVAGLEQRPAAVRPDESGPSGDHHAHGGNVAHPSVSNEFRPAPRGLAALLGGSGEWSPAAAPMVTGGALPPTPAAIAVW